MKDELRKKIIDDMLSEFFVVEDTVIIMEGLSIMFEEFLNGNTFFELSGAPEQALKSIEKRVVSLMWFAVKSLSVSADRLSKEYTALESRIIDAVSKDGET